MPWNLSENKTEVPLLMEFIVCGGESDNKQIKIHIICCRMVIGDKENSIKGSEHGDLGTMF